MTFEEFVSARLAALTRYSTALAGDPHTGADVLQDVLIKAQLRWSRIVKTDVPEAYVRKMVINELISTRRRIMARLRRERVELPAPVDDRSEQLAERAALTQLIQALPARQRIVIVLRYFEDMSDRDIAALLGCTVGTVRSQAFRALATLRSVGAGGRESEHRRESVGRRESEHRRESVGRPESEHRRESVGRRESEHRDDHENAASLEER